MIRLFKIVGNFSLVVGVALTLATCLFSGFMSLASAGYHFWAWAYAIGFVVVFISIAKWSNEYK